MSEDLAPCPMCGGIRIYLEAECAVGYTPEVLPDTYHEIGCSDCCIGGVFETQAKAITAWNTRAETRPTHSDKGEVCKECNGKGTILTAYNRCPECEGKGMIPANPGNPGEGPEPCPTCQPSDKLEGEPVRLDLKFTSMRHTHCEYGIEEEIDHIGDLYAHIDRLNAELEKERGKP